MPNGAIESPVYLSNDRITRAEETYVLMLAVLAAVCLFNRRRKAAS